MDHGNEAHGQNRTAHDLAAGCFFDERQLMRGIPVTDRREKFAAGFELVDQALGQLGWGGGQNDPVERGFVRPTLIAITVAHCDVSIAEPFESRGRGLSQRPENLDGVDLLGQAG